MRRWMLVSCFPLAPFLVFGSFTSMSLFSHGSFSIYYFIVFVLLNLFAFLLNLYLLESLLCSPQPTTPFWKLISFHLCSLLLDVLCKWILDLLLDIHSYLIFFLTAFNRLFVGALFFHFWFALPWKEAAPFNLMLQTTWWSIMLLLCPWISVFSVNSSVYLVPLSPVRFLPVFGGSWLAFAVAGCLLQYRSSPPGLYLEMVVLVW